MKLSKEQRANRLAIRNKTLMDEVVSTIPYPENAVPKNGLPRWDVLPLSQKLPVCDWPKGTVEFCRNKVGKELWQHGDTGADFVLYDPYCYDVNYTQYNILHDTNLRDFFIREPTVSQMQDGGFISPSLGAYCTLKEFNEFRRYLRRLHMAEVDAEIAKIAAAQRVRIALLRADEMEERDRLCAAKNEAALKVALHAKNKAEEEKKFAKKMQLKNKREHDQYVKELAEKKRLAQEEHEARTAAHNEMIRKKQIMSKEIVHQKGVDAKVKSLINQMKFKQKMAREKRECEYLKCINLSERWDRTIELQNKRISFEDELHKKQKLMNDFNVQMRKEMAERRQRKLAKHIEERKYRNRRRVPCCTCEIAPPRYAVDKKKLALMEELTKKKSTELDVEQIDTTINTLYGIYIHQNVSQILLDIVRDVMYDGTGAANLDEDYNVKKKNQNRVYNIYRVDRIDLNTPPSRKLLISEITNDYEKEEENLIENELNNLESTEVSRGSRFMNWVIDKIIPAVSSDVFKLLLFAGIIVTGDKEESEESLNKENLNGAPNVVPCFDGEELQIDPNLVANGLLVLSIKQNVDDITNRKQVRVASGRGSSHSNVLKKSGLIGNFNVQKNVIQSRNSFWCIHRPEMRKLSWTKKLNQQQIVSVIEEHAVGDYSEPKPGTNKWNNDSSWDNCFSQDNPSIRPQGWCPEGCEVEYTPISEPRFHPITDDDLSEEYQVHKSCVGMCIDIDHGYFTNPQVYMMTGIEKAPKKPSKPQKNSSSHPGTDEENNSSQQPEEEISDISAVSSGASAAIPAASGTSAEIYSDTASYNSIQFKLKKKIGQPSVALLPMKKPSEPEVPPPVQCSTADNLESVTVLLPPRDISRFPETTNDSIVSDTTSIANTKIITKIFKN